MCVSRSIEKYFCVWLRFVIPRRQREVDRTTATTTSQLSSQRGYHCGRLFQQVSKGSRFSGFQRVEGSSVRPVLKGHTFASKNSDEHSCHNSFIFTLSNVTKSWCCSITAAVNISLPKTFRCRILQCKIQTLALETIFLSRTHRKTPF